MAAISIVVPVYNTPEEYFRACMASVLAQRFADYEVILVDDGSTTGIGAVCDEYAAKDKRFCVIHQENKGVSAARNAGLAAAAGEWVIFLDPDDWWEPDTLAPLYETAKREALDVLFFAMYAETPGGREVLRCLPQKEAGAYVAADRALIDTMQKELLDVKGRTMPACFGAAWSQLISRRLLAEHGLCFDETLSRGEDTLFDLRLWQAARRMAVWDVPLYHYRQNTASATHRYNAGIAASMDRTNKQVLAFLEQTHKEAAYGEAYNAWLMMAYFIVMELDILHPQNPKPYGLRRRDWAALPQAYDSFARLAQVRWGRAYPQRALLCFAAFRLRSFALTRCLMGANALRRKG